MAAPVALTSAGNVTTATDQSASATGITITKPANVAVGDTLVAWVAAQNNTTNTPPGHASWTRVGPTFTTSGDAARRPMSLLVLRVTDSTVLAGLPSSWTFTGPNANRFGGGIQRVTGADMVSDPTTWAFGAFNTNSGVASADRVLTAVTVPTDDHLLVMGTSGQMSAGTAPSSVSWSGSPVEGFDICTISSGTNSHQTMSMASQEADTGSTGTRTATYTAVPASASGYMVAIPPSSVLTATGQMPLEVGLTGTAVAVKTATGSLSLDVALAGSAVAVKAVTGTLALVVGLAGAVVPVRTTTGTHPLVVGLISTESGIRSATGSMPLVIGLEGASSGFEVKTTSGAMPLVVGLAGASVQVLTTTGSLPLGVALAGTAVPVKAATGDLPIAVGLAGDATPVRVATGELGLVVGLVGVAVRPFIPAQTTTLLLNATSSTLVLDHPESTLELT